MQPTFTLHTGDALEIARQRETESVHVIVTSPPYWNLRDYGVEGQMGLEKHPAEWRRAQVVLFRELRRVLRKDGLLFVNCGDAYATSRPAEQSTDQNSFWKAGDHPMRPNDRIGEPPAPQGYQAKDLLMLPARLAIALQEDGWCLRAEIVWSKANPMPESVTDRPTKSHEMIYMFAKSASPTFWTHRDRAGSRTLPEPDYRWRHRDTKEERRVEPAGSYIWVNRQTGERQAHVAGMVLPAPWRLINLWRKVNLWRGRDYFYDNDEVREPYKPETLDRRLYGDNTGHVGQRRSEHQPKTTSDEAVAAMPKGTHPDGGKIRERALYGVNPAGRNRRTVWEEADTEEAFIDAVIAVLNARQELGTVFEVPTPNFDEGHFATFPEELVEPCIKAAASKAGCCAKCKAPLRRVVEVGEQDEDWVKSAGANKDGTYHGEATKEYAGTGAQNPADVKARILAGMREKRTIGWRPTCGCWDCKSCKGFGYKLTKPDVVEQLDRPDGPHEQSEIPCAKCKGTGQRKVETVPCVVYDPFGGSHTTGRVALRLGQSYEASELNPEYQEIGRRLLMNIWRQPGFRFEYAGGE
jgi:DNA modification methylase